MLSPLIRRIIASLDSKIDITLIYSVHYQKRSIPDRHKLVPSNDMFQKQDFIPYLKRTVMTMFVILFFIGRLDFLSSVYGVRIQSLKSLTQFGQPFSGVFGQLSSLFHRIQTRRGWVIC